MCRDECIDRLFIQHVIPVEHNLPGDLHALFGESPFSGCGSVYFASAPQVGKDDSGLSLAPGECLHSFVYRRSGPDDAGCQFPMPLSAITCPIRPLYFRCSDGGRGAYYFHWNPYFRTD